MCIRDSGSGGGGIPPNCGGPTSGNRIEGNEPCEPGWEPIEPIEDDPPPPCDSYMTTLGNDSNFAAKFKSLTDTSVLNRNYEKGFYIADRTANSYISVQGTPGSPSIYFNGATLPMDGFLHSHTNPLNQAPMFSPDDVLLMAEAVSYTHLRAHETVLDLVCRLLLEKKKTQTHI